MTTTPRATPAPAVNEALLRQLAAEIREEIPEAEVRLFGSHARGVARPDSDIDLLITVSDGWLAQHNRFEVLKLVVEGKWLDSLEQAVSTSVERVSQALSGRIKELGERYGEALPAISQRVEELEARVAGHLERMGCAWN